MRFSIKKLILLQSVYIFSLNILVFTPSKAQENHYNHGELNWRTIETPHFFINFHEGAERTARVIAKVAEDIYGPVTSLYQHEPEHKVSFIIKDYDDYSNGAAYFYDNKIEIWAPALDFDLRGTHNWLRNVIAHEFTHIIQIQTSMKFGRRFPGFYLQWLNYEEERRQDVLYGYPNTVVSYPISGFVVPSWFAEGVAQYNRPEMSYDYWDSHRDMILRSYALDSNMLSWREMSVFGKTSLGNESAYNAGFALTKYISKKYGQDAIPKISKNISRLNNVTIDQAIELAIGKTGDVLYDEWKNYVVKDYSRRTDPIYKNRVEGEMIASSGFANFYSVFSPDGNTIAYTSNKSGDYFGSAGIFIHTIGSKKTIEIEKEKSIIAPVHSTLSWSLDSKKIFFSKITHENPNSSQLSDLYAVELETKKETRLTFGLRAMNPSLSADGSLICFAKDSDGTANIGICDSIGKNVKILTSYKNGEQVFTPKWSPDGKKIIYGFSHREEQDILEISLEQNSIETIVSGIDDARNPVYSTDGSYIYFSSDRTGIFNIYRYSISDKSIQQMSNVLGGAFMPTVNNRGDVAYSLYTSDGFKINYLKQAQPKDFSQSKYLEQETIRRPDIAIDSLILSRNQFDFVTLRNYNDTIVGTTESKIYKNIFTSVSIIPFLRIDNYNTKSSGLDFLKPGFYFLSSDVVDKFNMFGGAAINHILERDLFLIFEYRDRIVGFKQLGFYPTISFEMYNITRKRTNEKITIVKEFNETQADVTYSLFETDLNIKNHILSENDLLTLGFSHSEYSSGLSTFYISSSVRPIPASSEKYFIGNNVLLKWEYNGILRSRTSEINPLGRTFSIKLDNEFNKFTKEDSTGSPEIEVSESGIKLKLIPYNIHKVELRYTEHFQLPYLFHTLSFTLHSGTIFGPKVPDFFDFYAGGLIGMKGYPFYSIGGNEIATLNMAYRFPIWEKIDFRLFQIYFDKLYGEFHADFGNAWDGLPNIKDFKKDVGFEFRLETFSWYAYPTRIFFNGTYGLDSFKLTKGKTTVRYGQEWRFYFGVLFGFDFSNNVSQALRYFNEK